MIILNRVNSINKEIEKKQRTAEMCKEIINNLSNPTHELTNLLIKLKNNYPERYKEIEPTIKMFLAGNEENIDIIGLFLINNILHIGNDTKTIEQETEQKADIIKTTNSTHKIIGHLKNKLFDNIREDIFSDTDFVFLIANAINNATKNNEGYKTISSYSKKEIEFMYKGNVVRLNIANIMQYIGKQKTGSIGKFKEGHDAFVKYLEEKNFTSESLQEDSNNQDNGEITLSIEETSLLPEDFSRIPLTVKKDKNNLYKFMLELREKLTEKIPNEHFIRIKPTNPDVRRLELSIVVNNYIITNTVHNIYNTLSKLFFDKQGNFAQVHQLLIDIVKEDADTLWSKNISAQIPNEKENYKEEKQETHREEKSKKFIASSEVEAAFRKIIEKHSGRAQLDKFIEHYKLKEDESAMKCLQTYKIILWNFVSEIQKFTNDKEIIEKIRSSIKDITDNRLDTPLKAYRYVHKDRYGGPTTMIIDMIKEYNHGN